MLLLLLLQLVTASTAWQWDPNDPHHPCTIERYDPLQLATAFGPRGVLPSLYHSPVILVRPPHENEDFRRLSTKANLLEFFGDNFKVTLSSSNAQSEHRQEMLLRDYPYSNVTTPHALSNTTWYFFGETYSEPWQAFLQQYQLPPCASCTDDSSVALAFGIGNCGSGVQWHVHGPGFSESLVGRKHWVLYPPPQQQHKRLFDKDQSSLAWMEYVYPSLKQQQDLPLECTVHPGEAIYFPDQWYHATINLDNYTAFVSTFTTEHNVVSSGGAHDEEL